MNPEHENSIYNPIFFKFYAIFNLHHKFLYAGTICIPMRMISIPAGKNLEKEKSI